MIPTHRAPTHPGEMLLEEFLKPMGLTQTRLATHIGVQLKRINEIINAKRGITADTAWRTGAALGTTPEFWMRLQATYDLATSRPDKVPSRLTA